MLKADIRKEFLNTRKNIPFGEKEILNSKIFENVKKSDLYIRSQAILAYVSTSDEVDTRKLIVHALKQNKTVAVPVCDYQKREMVFVKIDSISDLTICKKGIYEPEFDENKVITQFDNALCIVPGLAFNKNGYRVGYGGGFYDKFLEDFCGTSLGICYEQFLVDAIKVESHDIAVNYIATEHGIIDC